jgi:hypothetical protein
MLTLPEHLSSPPVFSGVRVTPFSGLCTKGIIRIRNSKKHRQHNGQKKKYKKTNNDLQNIHINLKMELHEPH